MKKISTLLLLSAITCLCVTSCAEVVSENLDDVDAIKESLNRINSYNYKQDFTTMSLYSKEVSKERFSLPEDASDELKSAATTGYTVVNKENVFRLDFSDSNDYYIYDFESISYSYLTSFDNKSGRPAYEVSPIRQGYQFYKANKRGAGERYYFEEFSTLTGTMTITDLDLDSFALISDEHISELEIIEDSLLEKNYLTVEQGKNFFEWYLMPIVEKTYRINYDIILNYQSDGTNAYTYSATEKGFFINTDKELEFEKEVTTFDSEKNEIKGETKNVLSPNGFDFRTLEPKFKVNKRFWADLVEEKEVGTRRVNVEYANAGWISKADISDERSNYEHILKEGVDSIVTSLYLINDFNVEIPHNYTPED